MFFYPNVLNFIEELRKKSIYIALVSNVQLHIKKIIKFFNIDLDFIVCYHDVNKHKPESWKVSIR